MVSDDRDTELADALAEAGRRVGQAITDVLERMRPAFDALKEAANRPEVRTVIDHAEKVMRRRPCFCLCLRAHPTDRGICEAFDAVITVQYRSDLLGEIDVPLCAPCAAAWAAREFAR
jgi:hypothetical protein